MPLYHLSLSKSWNQYLRLKNLGHCGIDLVCELPVNSTGFRHILVIVCYLTKFVAARALKSKTTIEVLDKLQDIYLTYGVPKVIQHDQGK